MLNIDTQETMAQFTERLKEELAASRGGDGGVREGMHDGDGMGGGERSELGFFWVPQAEK